MSLVSSGRHRQAPLLLLFLDPQVAELFSLQGLAINLGLQREWKGWWKTGLFWSAAQSIKRERFGGTGVVSWSQTDGVWLRSETLGKGLHRVKIRYLQRQNKCIVPSFSSRSAGGDGGAGDGCARPPSWSGPTRQSQTLRSRTRSRHGRCGNSPSPPSSFPRSLQQSEQAKCDVILLIYASRHLKGSVSLPKAPKGTYPIFPCCPVKVPLLSPPDMYNRQLPKSAAKPQNKYPEKHIWNVSCDAVT